MAKATLTLDDDDRALVLCVPIDKLGVPAEGSTRAWAACGHEVWISPATMEIVSGEGAEVYCVPCGWPKVLEEEHEFQMPTKAQRREFAREVAARRARS